MQCAAQPPSGSDEGLCLGAAFGAYVLDRRLGAGAQAEVFACRHRDGGEYAAKAFRKSDLFILDEDGDLEPTLEHTLFRRELEISCALRHQSIMEVVEVVEDDEYYYLVMPLGQEDLWSLIERGGALSEGQAKAVFTQLVAGLDHMHTRSVLHRDLKLENIIVAREASSGELWVKIGDFGLSKQVSWASAPDGGATLKRPHPLQSPPSPGGGGGGCGLGPPSVPPADNSADDAGCASSSSDDDGEPAGAEEEEEQELSTCGGGDHPWDTRSFSSTSTMSFLPPPALPAAAALAGPGPRLVRATSTVGTPDYMAPEVTSLAYRRPGGVYEKEVDYFSLGICLFVMLTGRFPQRRPSTLIKRSRRPRRGFRREDDDEEDEEEEEDEFFAREDLASLPPAAGDLVRGLTRKAPSERYGFEECCGHAWVLSPSQ